MIDELRIAIEELLELLEEADCGYDGMLEADLLLHGILNELDC